MVARIVLRGAKTYQLGGKRWIKDVPGIVKGEENIKQFQQNGYFLVKILDKKKPKQVETAEVEEPKTKKAKSNGKPKLKK